MVILTWMSCHYSQLGIHLLSETDFCPRVSLDYFMFGSQHELNVQQNCPTYANRILKLQIRNKQEHLGKSSILDLQSGP